jgi:hypothetical protein
MEKKDDVWPASVGDVAAGTRAMRARFLFIVEEGKVAAEVTVVVASRKKKDWFLLMKGRVAIEGTAAAISRKENVGDLLMNGKAKGEARVSAATSITKGSKEKLEEG